MTSTIIGLAQNLARGVTELTCYTGTRFQQSSGEDKSCHICGKSNPIERKRSAKQRKGKTNPFANQAIARGFLVLVQHRG